MTLITVTVSTSNGPVEVTGDQVTDHFAITPSIGRDADTEGPVFTGRTCLTHIPSGLVVSYDSHGQRERAARLEALPIDWSTVTRGHAFTDEDTAAVYEALREPDGEGWPWPEWAGDESTPALTLLAKTLDRALDSTGFDDDGYWRKARNLAAEVAEHAPDDLAKKVDAFLTAAASIVSVSEYGLAYLLAVVHRVDPDAADRAARDLIGAWDAGDSMSEWLWQWRDELGKGLPLTLHDFPDRGDFASKGTESPLDRARALVLAEHGPCERQDDYPVCRVGHNEGYWDYADEFCDEFTAWVSGAVLALEAKP